MKRVVIFLLFVLTACETVVDVDVPFEEKGLVVNSFISPDSLFSARITLNKFILDDALYTIVPDATVTISKDGSPIETLTFDGKGAYRSSSLRPEVDVEYAIEVTHPKYGTATAETKIPVAVPMEVTDFELTDNNQMLNDANVQFKVMVHDPAGEANFYQIEMLKEVSFEDPTTHQGFRSFNTVPIFSDDEGIDVEKIVNVEGFYFPDHLFDGKETIINVKGHNYNGILTQGFTEKFYIVLRTLSREYYNYKTTVLLQDYVADDPFAQPVKVFNNIENGFGIFAGYNQAVYVYEK